MRYIVILMMSLLIACGGSDDNVQSNTGQHEEIRLVESILIVIAPRDFRDEEFKEPYELLTQSGAKVSIASTDTLPSKGMLGMVVKPDMILEQVAVDSFDVLIIVGGKGCEVLWDNPVLNSIVKEFNEANKIIAAICIAPVVLARAGILNDIEVTAFPSVKEDIARCGGCFVETKIAVCNNIITGSGPKAAKAFAQTVLCEIGKRQY